MAQTMTTEDDGRSLLPHRPQTLEAAAAATTVERDPDDQRTLEAAASLVSEAPSFDLEALADAVASRMGRAAQGDAFEAARKFGSLFEAVSAVRAGDPDALAAFVLVDQITTNNAGVIPPGWLQDVKGIVDWNARAISALGGPASLPDAGMDVTWPYYNGTLSSLIGQQLTQKAEITSARVDLLKGSSNLRTYAGGSDVSWQLLLRSSPTYRERYLQILTAAYNVVTDAAFVGAPAGGTGLIGMAKAATTEIVLDLVLAGTTADAIRAAIFDASVTVEDITGQPASVILAATDVFKAFGGKAGLVPTSYNPSNASGTADAASLKVEISGLPVVRVPSLPNGYAVVTNPTAARWHGTGPQFAQADEVSKLGTDMAVWGMGTDAVYLPKGVVRIVKVATA
jgi:hypothetical protein